MLFCEYGFFELSEIVMFFVVWVCKVLWELMFYNVRFVKVWVNNG